MNSAYLKLRTRNLRDAAHLYFALLRSLLARLARNPAYRTPGQFLRHRIQVRVNGCWMAVRPLTDDLFYVLPGHKPSVERWYRPAAGETVVDVGAHIGYFSVSGALHGARAIAIEGNPATFEVLNDNVQRTALGRVTPIRAIVGAGGPATMTVVGGFYGMASTRPDWVPPAGGERGSPLTSAPTQSESIDSILEPLGIGRIDWLLVDIEGSESEALRSAPRTLSNTLRIIVEVHDTPAPAELEETLRRAGLSVVQRERQSEHTEYWLAHREPLPD